MTDDNKYVDTYVIDGDVGNRIMTDGDAGDTRVADDNKYMDTYVTDGDVGDTQYYSLPSLFDNFESYTKDYRISAANDVYTEIQRIINQHEQSEVADDIDILYRYNSLHHMFSQHERRFIDVNNAIAVSESDLDDTWIHGMTLLGITTCYKLDESSGMISVRLQGNVDDLPLFEQLCVIYEVDLYKDWIPFCENSTFIHKLGQAELLAYIGLCIPPGISRDTVLHCYGSDCLLEDNKLILIGQSIDHTIDTVLKNNHINDSIKSRISYKSIGWFSNRMDIIDFKAILEPLATTSVRTTITATVNPNTILPTMVVNFIIRNLAGMFLYVFQNQVKKVLKTPFKKCPHKQRIVSNKDFYHDWILPKLKVYIESKGWNFELPALFKTNLAPDDTTDHTCNKV